MVFHAGKLKEYLAVFALKHLDVGRYHAKLVDTVAEHVGGRVVDTVLDLALELGAHSVVACARGYEALEDDGEVGLRLALAVLLYKCAHEIVGIVLEHLTVGSRDGRLKYGVGVAALHGAEHVGHVDLQDYVHAALEVEAEAHAPLAYVVERIAQVHGLLSERVHVVLVGLVVGGVVVVARCCYGIGLCLTLVLRRYECKREVEQAHQYQENSDNTGYDAAQISFALHVLVIWFKWLKNSLYKFRLANILNYLYKTASPRAKLRDTAHFWRP